MLMNKLWVVCVDVSTRINSIAIDFISTIGVFNIGPVFSEDVETGSVMKVSTGL